MPAEAGANTSRGGERPLAAAGAELCSTFALACVLQADWKLPSGQAMFEPSLKHLPDYGFAVTNLWNRVGGQAVPDPFGMVKCF